MAVARIHSCLNGPPAMASPSTTVSKLAISPWSPGIKESCWRGRCVSTVACVILGSAVGLAEIGAGTEDFAYAGEIREAEAGAGGGEASRRRVARWSEKRECPPWRNNSLENVVPENLPRRSARRRLESVNIASRRAPAVSSSCFTL